MNFCYTRTLIISVILYENWSQTNNNSHKLMIYQHTRSSRSKARKQTHKYTRINTHTHRRTKRMSFEFYRHSAVQSSPAHILLGFACFGKDTYAKYVARTNINDILKVFGSLNGILLMMVTSAEEGLPHVRLEFGRHVLHLPKCSSIQSQCWHFYLWHFR